MTSIATSTSGATCTGTNVAAIGSLVKVGTGTLTMNRMALRRLWVEGAGHQLGAEPAQPLPEAFHGTLEYAVLASHRRAFDPMEAAIAQARTRIDAARPSTVSAWW